jgi:hypothetical protein
MPALFFPNLDALRLAVASGLVPPEVARSPARCGSDSHGHVWLEADDLPRELLTALTRLGVQVLGSPGAVTRPVRCWAEVLPLRRATAPEAGGLVLFQVPDRRLASFVGRLRRIRKAPVGVALLPEPHAGRAWVTTYAPVCSVLLDDADTRAYWEQAPGVWVARGWEHPLASHLVVPEGGVLLCDTDRGMAAFEARVPEPRAAEFAIAHRPVAAPAPGAPPRIDVCFRLRRGDAGPGATFWVLAPDDEPAFREFCRGADERLLGRYAVASVGAGDERRLLVRRSGDPDPHSPVAGSGFQPDSRLPWLFVPAGFALRPAVRVNELAREFAQGEARIVWVEATEGGVAVHAVAESAFRPLADQVEYAAAQRVVLAAPLPPEAPFAFARFALQVETTIDLVPDPEPAEAPEPEPEEESKDDPGWVSKSVGRVLDWVRRRRADREPTDLEKTPRPEPRKRTVPEREPGRVEQKLASADALLHGHDWAARRHELESRLVKDLPRLSPDRRATRWAELAGVYAATGQWQDAAVCWTNAIWDRPDPPEAWFEHWASAECRAARRGERTGDLDRWLGEPGRPGTGRVVAALAALYGARPTPAPQFAAALPRVLAILEQQFDDIPVRAAWLARLAVARSCDGDALGVARWRDRLIRRLHDRGPGLDLDEPSFLRFRGRTAPERFHDAQDWLDRVRARVPAWLERIAEGVPGLQAVGLASETKATAQYAQLMFAWGLGALGERASVRDIAARARKELSGVTGPRVDPAGHAFLGDLFLHRIKEASEGHAPKPGLPAELQARHEKLPLFARYSADRLRDHSRILQPVGRAGAYRGLDLKELWGPDRLGERLSLLGSRTEAAQVNDEARALLAVAAESPATTTVPRIAFALLEVASFLDAPQLEALFELVPTALDWIEPWVQGRWSEAERAGRVARFRARMLESAFAAASAPAAEHLLRHLTRTAAGGMTTAITAAAPRIFRTARRYGLATPTEALVELLDPERGEWAERWQSLGAEQLGLAVGWLVAGNEDAGNRIIDAARKALYLAEPANLQQRTALALAYADALGFANASIALGRLEEIFQRLDRVTVHYSSNCYFTLQPLRLIDTVVRSVVTDDFTLGPAVRAWLDEDEFFIRRRIHRDMAALLRETE